MPGAHSGRLLLANCIAGPVASHRVGPLDCKFEIGDSRGRRRGAKRELRIGDLRFQRACRSARQIAQEEGLGPPRRISSSLARNSARSLRCRAERRVFFVKYRWPVISEF